MTSFGRCQCERCLPATAWESRLRLLIRAPFDSRGPKRFPRESKGARMRRPVETWRTPDITLVRWRQSRLRLSPAAQRSYQQYSNWNERTSVASRRAPLGRCYCTAPGSVGRGGRLVRCDPCHIGGSSRVVAPRRCSGAGSPIVWIDATPSGIGNVSMHRRGVGFNSFGGMSFAIQPDQSDTRVRGTQQWSFLDGR